MVSSACDRMYAMLHNTATHTTHPSAHTTQLGRCRQVSWGVHTLMVSLTDCRT